MKNEVKFYQRSTNKDGQALDWSGITELLESHGYDVEVIKSEKGQTLTQQRMIYEELFGAFPGRRDNEESS